MDDKEINELQDDDAISEGEADSINNLDSDDDLDSEIDDIEKIQQINDGEETNNFDLLNQDNDKTSDLKIYDSDEEFDDEYYQKFNNGLNTNYLEYFRLSIRDCLFERPKIMT